MRGSLVRALVLGAFLIVPTSASGATLTFQRTSSEFPEEGFVAFDDRGSETNVVTVSAGAPYTIADAGAPLSVDAASGCTSASANSATCTGNLPGGYLSGGYLFFYLGKGNDSIHNDQKLVGLVRAGAGADTIVAGPGDQSIDGGAGNDTIDGGSGNDDLEFVGNNRPVAISLVQGVMTRQGGERDTFRSIENVGPSGPLPSFGRAAVSITGNAGRNRLVSGSGADRIDGGAGNDTIDGLSGNDLLLGGGGNDTIYGVEGRDTVYAGAGNDLVTLTLRATDPSNPFQDQLNDFANCGSGYDTARVDRFDRVHNCERVIRLGR